MQISRAGLALGFSALVGCGGTYTQQGEAPGDGGSGGSGSSIETGGRGGTVAKGGTGNAGTISYGAYGGDISYGAYGGDISIGGVGAVGGAAGEGGVGGDCGPSTSPSGPYPVRFVFSSNTPVYIKEECRLNYDLFSCNSGASPIVRDASCVADCNDTSIGCIACGACFSGAAFVGPGATVEDAWGGMIYKYGTLPSGCSCASGANAAPGVYTLLVSEYFTESDALMNTNPYLRKIQFELPAPNGTVLVDLGFTGI